MLVDPSSLYFAILGGVFFGMFVYYKGDAESTWRDIASWGFLVWLTFIGLANLNRFIEGDPDTFGRIIEGGIRWWAFIFTIIAVAGTMRMCRNRFRKGKNDCLSQ